MKTIHKYYLHMKTHQILQLPSMAKIIDVKKIGSGIYMWTIVDTENILKDRDIYLVGTGHEMPAAYVEHIGTIEDEGFIWHFFEGIN